nr:nuclear transport factor 2 family protein [Rhodococcus sp. 06-621-2]
MTDIETRLTALEHELDDLRSREDDLRSREEIRDVMHRYCRAVDRLDAELLKSCYHDDANDTHWFANGPAHPFSDWVVAEVLPHAHTTVHSLTNPIIELRGERAFVESHVHVLHEMAIPGADPDTPHMHQLVECRYLDIFERRDRQWKIHYRHVVVDNCVEFMVPVYPTGRRPAAALGRRNKDDAVYAEFDLEKLRPEDKRIDFFAQFLAQEDSSTR